MHPIVAKLIELDRIEAVLDSGPAAKAEKELIGQANSLRAEIPTEILARYDQLDARGKGPVVAVINNTCRGCYLRLSTGALAALRDKTEIHICEHCGRYIYPMRPLGSTARPCIVQNRKKPSAKQRCAETMAHGHGAYP
jgi:hypothetical protein